MTEKRKKRVDSNGEVLHTGELQKKNGIYQYKYKDSATGKYRYETSPTLAGLREKEKTVERMQSNGILYADSKITLAQQLERYIALKISKRESTQRNYNAWLRIIKREKFSQRRLCDIKMSDAKMWYQNMWQSGKAYGTIAALTKLLKPACRMACDDDVIVKNPFAFRIDEVLSNDSEEKIALNDIQVRQWLDFIREDAIYSKHYDIFIVLLYTGMRVSELCGLTLADLDFEQKEINIDKQLLRKVGGYYVQPPKTKAGKRHVAMLPEAYSSLKRLVERRRNCKIDPLVDGYSGFLLLNTTGKPKTSQDIDAMMRRAQKRFGQLYSDTLLPCVTPHVFRHTFCTMMLQAGMSIKDVQSIMGHENASTTLNIYAHMDNKQAVKNMANIYAFSALKELNCATI